MSFKNESHLKHSTQFINKIYGIKKGILVFQSYYISPIGFHKSSFVKCLPNQLRIYI